MRLNNETIIDFDSLKYDLYIFYNDEEYQELFDDIICKKQIKGNYIELTNMVQFAEFSGLLSNEKNNVKRRIIITLEECAHIIASYSDLYFEKMNILTKKYLYYRYLEELNGCLMYQNMSCGFENNEKLLKKGLIYIYHEERGLLLAKKRK